MNKKLKLVVGILTYNRDTLLLKTIESFLKYNLIQDMDFVLFDNYSDEPISQKNENIASDFNIKYFKNSTVYLSDWEESFSYGHQEIIKLLKKYNSEYYCILEDDWECFGRIDFNAIDEFWTSDKNIGQIRLRDFRYDDSMYGGSKLNFVTKEEIKFKNEMRFGDTTIKTGNLTWVNNPCIIKREVLEPLSQGFKSEYSCMEYFHTLFPNNAQIVPGIFRHIGPWRIRNDLRNQGFFGGS